MCNTAQQGIIFTRLQSRGDNELVVPDGATQHRCERSWSTL
jgi:hypothetical protein